MRSPAALSPGRCKRAKRVLGVPGFFMQPVHSNLCCSDVMHEVSTEVHLNQP
jgi:hypothetical protein